MDSTLTDREAAMIRNRVMRGLALNRTPGLHFLGNFLDLSFEQVDVTGTHLRMAAGPHCMDVDGQMNIGALSLLTDLAMSASVRASLPQETRLGTVSMQVQFTGVPCAGPLDASGVFDGYLPEGASKVGMTHGEIRGPHGLVARCNGTFMVLDPPSGRVLAPVPYRRHGDDEPPMLDDAQLNDEERSILLHADRTLSAERRRPATGFASRFLGFAVRPDARGAAGRLRNGPHIGNRVGHVQGGISFGFAAATAKAALGGDWMLSNVTASYVSPGRDAVLRARSRIVHRGGLTAVVRTQVIGAQGRIVLDVSSNHLRRMVGSADSADTRQ